VSLHLCVGIRDGVAAECFIASVFERIREAEGHELSGSCWSINFIYLFFTRRLGICYVFAILEPPLSRCLICFFREKTRLHALKQRVINKSDPYLLKQTFFLCKIHDDNFDRTCEIDSVSHAEAKPLKGPTRIAIAPHVNVEL